MRRLLGYKNLPKRFDATDSAQFGPAMLKLTPKMRRFVDSLLVSDGVNFTRAALDAGYSQNSMEALAVTAHRLAHDTRIQAAIQEETARRLKSGQLMASRVLIDIAKNESVEPKDRLKAVNSILDRTGHSAVQKHETTVKHTMDEGEIVGRITQLCTLMGLDARKMIGRTLQIEGQAEEITEPEQYDAEGSTEGLEDVL